MLILEGTENALEALRQLQSETKDLKRVVPRCKLSSQNWWSLGLFGLTIKTSFIALLLLYLRVNYAARKPFQDSLHQHFYFTIKTRTKHFTKKSLMPLVGRAAKVHSIVLPWGAGGEPLLHLLGSVPTNCPFTITRPCTRSVLHAGCAAKLHCPSPRVPESPQNLGHGENTRRSLFFAFGAAQSCRC